MKRHPPETAPPATLYYDGQCPLCRAEMTRLEKLKSPRLLLADIHTLPHDATLPDEDSLLRTLHLRLPNGQLLTGAEANVAAWQFTPRGIWFRWMRWPLIGKLIDLVYDSWARWRYQRLYGRCRDLGDD